MVLLLAGGSRVDAAGQPRVAVLDFQGTGASKDTEALGIGLQSMLTTDLAQVSSIALVERARLRDLQKESKLSRSSLADPATAVRLGKLAGASHLITGSHTELNKKMRLDARLVEVATGKVIVAASAEGELDAFFELEKTLVGKLIDAIGVKLSVKERGAVARIHTTDFEAFRQFSSGVQLFDQEKYDESLVALRAALKKDDDFKLARTTLDTYERLAAELRGRAADIDTGEKTATRERNEGRQSEERKVLDRLFELARATGGDRFRRAAATYMLACVHIDQTTGATIYGLEDSFAAKRTTDALAQRFYPDALALFPRVPLVVHCLSQIGPDAPREFAKFDQEFDEIAKRLDSSSGQDLNNLRRTGEMAAHLHLDVRGEADLTDKVYELASKLKPTDDWRLEMLEARAILRMSLLDFDEAARLQKQSADIVEKAPSAPSEKAERLRRYAARVEDISVMSELLKRVGKDPLMREYALMRMGPQGDAFSARWKFEAKDIVKEIDRNEFVSRLPWFRQIRVDDHVLLGRTPVWPLRSGAVSGPRADHVRTEEVRYHSGERQPDTNVLIFEGVPRKELKTSFELAFGLPPDFVRLYPKREREPPNAAHPHVTFLFAAKCIDCRRTPDPATGHWKFDRQPLSAWGLELGANEVRLVQVALDEGRGGGGSPAVTITAQAAQPAALTGDTIPVSINLQGATLTATIQGKTFTFAVPAQRPAGFYGALLQGPGFVALRRLETGAAAH